MNYILDCAEVFGISKNRTNVEMTDALDFLINISNVYIGRKFKRFKTLADLQIEYQNNTLPNVFDVIFNEEMKSKITEIRVDIKYMIFLEEILSSTPKR